MGRGCGRGMALGSGGAGTRKEIRENTVRNNHVGGQRDLVRRRVSKRRRWRERGSGQGSCWGGARGRWRAWRRSWSGCCRPSMWGMEATRTQFGLKSPGTRGGGEVRRLRRLLVDCRREGARQPVPPRLASRPRRQEGGLFGRRALGRRLRELRAAGQARAVEHLEPPRLLLARGWHRREARELPVQRRRDDFGRRDLGSDGTRLEGADQVCRHVLSQAHFQCA